MARMDRQELTRLARLGAIETVRGLLKTFPDLLDEFTPRRRVPREAREQLAASNGAAPNPRTWTAARRRKFMATVRRKQRASRSSAGGR